MRKTILFYIINLVLFVNFGANAIERPAAVPSKLVELNPEGWYKNQAGYWKAFLEAHPEDQQGWLEYFKALHYANTDSEVLKDLANDISDKFANSFQAHYTQAQILGWTAEGIKHWQLAAQLAPSPDVMISEKLMLAEYHLDRDARNKLANQLYNSKAYSPSLLNYGYNVLMSVGEDGILVVQGEAASIPLWVLQDVMGIRQDVKLFDLTLAQNQGYLKRWMATQQLQGYSQLKGLKASALMQQLPQYNKNKDFYYALTLLRSHTEAIDQRLYVVGLASQLESPSIDNYQVLKENIEQRFMLDYLTVDFNGEPKYATGKVYSVNYILPFMLLREYYHKQGDFDKATAWRNKIMTMVKKTPLRGRVGRIASLLDNKSKKPYTPITMDTKGLDKQMMLIKGNLYASAFELTNREYWAFLEYLQNNGYDALFEQYKAVLSKYDDYTRKLLGNYHYSPTNLKSAQAPRMKGKHYLGYPAIDMTHEAAKAYCDWLTFQYNQQAGRKYRKVQFRLPTQQEWTMAALGYKAFTSWNLKENTVTAPLNFKARNKPHNSYNLAEYTVSYPWWSSSFSKRNSITNNKNCYLANVKTPDEIVCPVGVKGDGFTMTSFIGAYFANGMGLYDVVGNVGEMVQQAGIAMGGSWNHEPADCTIISANTYDHADATVGLRLFMEVIEE